MRASFTTRLALVLLPLGASLAARPGIAHAQAPAVAASPTDAIARARPHFMHGVKLYEEDDFRAALIEFNRAYELAPNWAVLFNIGQSYYQLRDYPDALRTLEKYVAQGGADIPHDRRAQVDKEIEELRGRSAHMTVTSNTVGADVFVDDVSIGQTPLAPGQLVGAGRHTVRVAKTGFAATSQIVDVAGGDEIRLTLDLAAPASPVPPPTTAMPQKSVSYTPAIVSVAVGGAGLVTGAVFGILAMNSKSSLTSECRGTACPASAQGDIDAFSRDGAISTVGFAIGGAGVAAAVILYFTERPRKERAAAPAAGIGTEIQPWFSGTSTGLRGRF